MKEHSEKALSLRFLHPDSESGCMPDGVCIQSQKRKKKKVSNINDL